MGLAQNAVAVKPQPIIVEPGHLPSMCDSCESRGVSVCSVLEEDDLHRLADAATVVEAPAGKIFIHEGDSADHFYNLTSGTVKLYKLLPDGRRQITGFCHRGDFLGLAVSATYAVSAEAVDDVRFCRFSRGGLRTMLEDFPILETRLLNIASNELVAAQEQMLLLGRKTARERLASFLLAQDLRSNNCPHKTGDILDLAITRSDIADYLGLTVETVSRTFTRLRKEDLIALPSSNKVVLLDRDALISLADGFDSDI